MDSFLSSIFIIAAGLSLKMAAKPRLPGRRTRHVGRGGVGLSTAAALGKQVGWWGEHVTGSAGKDRTVCVIS